MKKRKDSKNRVLKDGEYERKNGTYEFRYTDLYGGRRSIYAKSLADLREKEQFLLFQDRKTLLKQPENMTFADLWDVWIQTKTNIRRTTLHNYDEVYKKRIKPLIGGLKLKDIGRPVLRQMIQTYEETSSNQYVDLIYTIVNQVLSFAEEEEFIAKNPAKRIKKHATATVFSEEQSRTALTKTQQERFEEWIKVYRNGQYYDLFTVMLWTGLRVGELAALTWDCVDLKGERIIVNKTFVYYTEQGKTVYGFNPPKSKAGNRTIPMLPVVKEILSRKYTAKIPSLTEYSGHSDFVFLSSRRTPIKQKCVCDSLSVCCINYNKNNPYSPIPVLRPHELRHTFATRMIEYKVDAKTLQAVLGHTNIEITLNLYVHSSEEHRNIEFKRISEELFKAVSTV